ncbi:hypothetical protein [Deinococcus maricopensis]|uniref:Outer membrane protein beta-barrel domain-containing protein n=1 Tax=Deinococcus maricopensis (strain DSM 21211 / LMG 22137 / NRRL B-23946 / LB-34) TaxID=709986 RepID=E8U9N2_DEIML|nr:hypothetical protein [Deinococcus maricopensis]ADV67771.1 hypothetical protein Deima_2129 [Deinococcus maricopensis DSM 21211]
MNKMLMLALLSAATVAGALNLRAGAQGGYVGLNPAVAGPYGGAHFGIQYPVRWGDGRWSLQHTLEVQVVDHYPVVQFDSAAVRSFDGAPFAYYGFGLGSGVVPGNVPRMGASTLALLNAHALLGVQYAVTDRVNLYGEGVARAFLPGLVSATVRAGVQYRF